MQNSSITLFAGRFRCSLRRRPNSKRRRIGSAYNGAILCSRDFNLFHRLGTRQRVSCIISASFCEREEK